MPTVIQNWCTYRIVKTYHCWCEYEYNTPPSYEPFIDLLVVGGGGWGWCNCKSAALWWWGWGGWVIVCEAYPLNKECSSYNISVWAWWWNGTKWWNSCFDNIVAIWWGYGAKFCGYWGYCAWSWWSGGGGWGSTTWAAWNWTAWQWNNWGNATNYTSWSGWWWAWWAWCSAPSSWIWWNGWDWILNDFSWECCYYWAWWGWWAFWDCAGWTGWLWWGWNGWCSSSKNWSNATFYWWGWGWGYGKSNDSWCYSWWSGYQWVVILRYKTDWTCWIKPTSTWWCKYTCWEWTIHRFDTVWALETFNPVYN